MREIEKESNLSLQRNATREEATGLILGELPGTYLQDKNIEPLSQLPAHINQDV